MAASRVTVLIVGVLGWAMAVGAAAGKEAPPAKARAAEPPATAPSAPATPSAPQAPQAQAPSAPKSPQAKVREEMRAKLNGTTWALELRPLEGGGKPVKDTLTFTTTQVTSERLGKAGFASSNYSVNVKDDLSVSWETMQAKEGEHAFWRGEIEGELMRGVLSQQPTQGPAANFSFAAKQAGEKKADTTPAKEPAAQPAPAAASSSAGTSVMVEPPAPVNPPAPTADVPAAPNAQQKNKGL